MFAQSPRSSPSWAAPASMPATKEGSAPACERPSLLIPLAVKATLILSTGLRSAATNGRWSFIAAAAISYFRVSAVVAIIGTTVFRSCLNDAGFLMAKKTKISAAFWSPTRTSPWMSFSSMVG